MHTFLFIVDGTFGTMSTSFVAFIRLLQGTGTVNLMINTHFGRFNWFLGDNKFHKIYFLTAQKRMLLFRVFITHGKKIGYVQLSVDDSLLVRQVWVRENFSAWRTNQLLCRYVKSTCEALYMNLTRTGIVLGDSDGQVSLITISASEFY